MPASHLYLYLIGWSSCARAKKDRQRTLTKTASQSIYAKRCKGSIDRHTETRKFVLMATCVPSSGKTHTTNLTARKRRRTPKTSRAASGHRPHDESTTSKALATGPSHAVRPVRPRPRGKHKKKEAQKRKRWRVDRPHHPAPWVRSVGSHCLREGGFRGMYGSIHACIACCQGHTHYPPSHDIPSCSD